MTRTTTPSFTLAPLFVLSLVFAGCPDDAGGAATDTTAETDTAPDTEVVIGGPCLDRNPARNPYFGDLHVHTTLSLDANVQGTRLRPADAYRFARGEEVGLQPYDADGNGRRKLRLSRALDFAAVTDHAEFLGTIHGCMDPDSAVYDHQQCVTIRDNPDVAFLTINALLAKGGASVKYPALCGDAGADCVEYGKAAWRETQDAANAANDLTNACAFTAFIGYEWSANPGTRNLHRNVIFRGDAVPDWPTSYFDAPYAQDLWAALDRDCRDAGVGCEVLAIPHNSNLSSDTMFTTVDKDDANITAAFAAAQRANEPLIEIMQHKGDSECTPGSTLSDELCGFEKMPYDDLASANLGLGITTPAPGNFVRDALATGLALGNTLGVNPFAYGFLASTDTHMATPGAAEEGNFLGHGGAGENHRDQLPTGLPDQVYFNPGGLAGVWAEENRRDALFDALERRETWGTSGPRIVVRFFGGWGYGEGMCDAADFAEQGYAGGVPMGGDLSAAPTTGGAPTFAVAAWRDPGDETTPGTSLQHVQIIKGWADDNATHVVVHDVAGDPASGASVDPATCAPTGAGADSLCTVWTDPDFDPAAPAFWYVRVLENPTCRWSTRLCVAAGVDCDKPETIGAGWKGCCDDRYETTIQERAWSSPIYYRAP